MIWQPFAQQLKRSGWHAALFLLTLILTPCALGLIAFCTNVLGPLAVPLVHLPWLGGVAFALAHFIHAWRHPPRLGKLPPLSQNELKAARSKLLKHRTTR